MIKRTRGHGLRRLISLALRGSGQRLSFFDDYLFSSD